MSRRVAPTAALLAAAALLAGADAASAASAPCRAEVRLEPPRAVVGQQVLYRVRIFSRDDVESVEWSHPPAFPSLRTETLPGDPQPRLPAPAPGGRVRDERRALFAERPGEHRLVAPELRCRLRGGETVTTPVPEARLPVTPASPELVGPLTLHVTVTPERVELGGSVRVAVLVRGAGNLWAMDPPLSADAFPGSELFARRPRLVLERGSALVVRRHFAWDVVPRSEGPLRVPPLTVPYLDPASGRVASARSEARFVAVVAGAAPAEPRARSAGGAASDAPPSGRGGASPAIGVLVLVLAGVTGLLVWRLRGSGARRPPAPSRDADEPTAALAAELRAALARHVDDAASVTPEELVARRPKDPAVAAAAHLLASVERARFDPEAPPPDAEAVRRAIAEL
ncbi:MAG: hypothetical protein ACQGVC_23400 [Myxococcota bacterium]